MRLVNAPLHDTTGTLSSEVSSTRHRLSWWKCPSQSFFNTASSLRWEAFSEKNVWQWMCVHEVWSGWGVQHVAGGRYICHHRVDRASSCSLELPMYTVYSIIMTTHLRLNSLHMTLWVIKVECYKWIMLDESIATFPGGNIMWCRYWSATSLMSRPYSESQEQPGHEASWHYDAAISTVRGCWKTVWVSWLISWHGPFCVSLLKQLLHYLRFTWCLMKHW